MISTVIIFRELFKMLDEKVYSAPLKYRLYDTTLNGSLALTQDTLCHLLLTYVTTVSAATKSKCRQLSEDVSSS